jgi:2-amino-4-hydroxy-6-hydroxymethyldihydropteridine diphosphokinase
VVSIKARELQVCNTFKSIPLTIRNSSLPAHTAYLLAGSNMGNPLVMLQQAADAIVSNGLGEIVARSSIYKTAAWGKQDQADFLNQALQLTTFLDPENLLSGLLKIELEMGRQRLQKNDPRTIDLDIIFFDAVVLNTEHLSIPHPLMHLRRFVLQPLYEIAPNFVHPVLKKTVTLLLETCPDLLHVDKFNVVL